MLRTHEAGLLSKSDVGTEVVLAGWVARRRDHGGVAFIDLRDASGAVQVVIKDERSEERRVGKECRIGCRSRWSPYH